MFRLLVTLTLCCMILLSHTAPVSRTSLQGLRIQKAKLSEGNLKTAPVSRASMKDLYEALVKQHKIQEAAEQMSENVLSSIAKANAKYSNRNVMFSPVSRASQEDLQAMLAEQQRIQAIILQYNMLSNIANAAHTNKKSMQDKIGNS